MYESGDDKRTIANRLRLDVMRSLWQRFLVSPVCPTILTFLVFFTGGWGSIFSSELRRAFPFEPYAIINPGEWVWQAVVFWTLFGIAAPLYFFRNREVEKQREAKQAELVERSDNVAWLVRTLPPSNFLQLFSQLYNTADKAYEYVVGPPSDIASRDDIKRGTRHILRMVGELGSHFDGEATSHRYHANIMRFVPSNNADPTDARKARESLVFCDKSVSFESLRGALLLDSELSVVSDDEEAEPDESVAEIALPVPVEGKVGGFYKALPGAPAAFVDQEPSIFPDTGEIRTWCERYGDFTHDVKSQLEHYFLKGAGTNVKSFMSVPLFPITEDGSDDLEQDPIAVLNLHADSTGMMKDERAPMIQFVAILRPLQVYLVKSLSALDECDEAGDGPDVQEATTEGVTDNQ
jgi:hypothetical protein